MDDDRVPVMAQIGCWTTLIVAVAICVLFWWFVGWVVFRATI